MVGWTGPPRPGRKKKEHNWEHNLGQNYFREKQIPKKYLNFSMFFAILDDFYGGLDRPSPTREGKKRSMTGSIIWGKTISNT